MSKVYVSYAVQESPLPAGRTYMLTQVSVIDSTGAKQSATAGTITMPDGSSAAGAVFDVTAPGGGSFVVSALDSTGGVLATTSGTFSISSPFAAPISAQALVV